LREQPSSGRLTAGHRLRTEYNFAGAIYGQILSLAIVAGLSEDSAISPFEMLGSLVVTMLVFWLAHAYANLIARGVTSRLSVTALKETLQHDWPLAQATLPPAIGLLLALVGLISRNTGVTVALALGVIALAVWAASIGRLGGGSVLGTLLIALESTAFGLVIVALKIGVEG
jgi:hypothetical protein